MSETGYQSLAHLALFASLAACDSLTVLELFPERTQKPEPDSGSVVSGGGSGGGFLPAPPMSARGDAGDGPIAADSGSGVPPPLHRYVFDGVGTVAVDSANAADGEILGGATLDGSGALALDGRDDFVDLPNGLLSSLESATLLAWVTWEGTSCWHRVFDFGSTDVGEGFPGTAITTLFLSPEPCPTSGPLTIFAVQPQQFRAGTATPARIGDPQFYAVVVNGIDSTLSLYIDGAQANVTDIGISLAELEDVNNWLGRSQWLQDYNMHGILHEFRIYGTALTAQDIALLHTAGPDVLP